MILTLGKPQGRWGEYYMSPQGSRVLCKTGVHRVLGSTPPSIRVTVSSEEIKGGKHFGGDNAAYHIEEGTEEWREYALRTLGIDEDEWEDSVCRYDPSEQQDLDGYGLVADEFPQIADGLWILIEEVTE